MKRFLLLSLVAHGTAAALLSIHGGGDTTIPVVPGTAIRAQLSVTEAKPDRAGRPLAARQVAQQKLTKGKVQKAAPAAPNAQQIDEGVTAQQVSGNALGASSTSHEPEQPVSAADRIVQDMWSDAVADLLQRKGLQFFNKKDGRAYLTLTSTPSGNLVQYRVSGDESAEAMVRSLVESIQAWPRFNGDKPRTFSRRIVFKSAA